MDRDPPFLFGEIVEMVTDLRLIRDGKPVRKKFLKGEPKPKPGTKPKGKGKGKGKETEGAPVAVEKASGPGPITKAEVYLERVAKIPSVQHLEKYETTLEKVELKIANELIGCMGAIPMDYHYRVSSNSCVRLLTVAGLFWSASSQNRWRDFGPPAFASILEDFVIGGYRERLLARCPGAARMRLDMAKYFLDLATTEKPPPEEPSSSTGKSKGDKRKAMPKNLRQMGFREPALKRKWAFADMIEVPSETTDLDDELSCEDVLMRLEDVHAKEAAQKNSLVAKLLEFGMRLPLVHYSDKGAEEGTMETSAFFHLSGLLQVSATYERLLCAHDSDGLHLFVLQTRPLVCDRLSDARATQDVQVIEARINHDALASEEPFDPSSVKIEQLLTMPHAVSDSLRKYVSVVLLPSRGLRVVSIWHCFIRSTLVWYS